MRYLNDIQQHLESLQKREGSLAAAIRGLDSLLAEHRAGLHPQLQHYLSQRSYDKALAWVNAELAGTSAAGASVDRLRSGAQSGDTQGATGQSGDGQHSVGQVRGDPRKTGQSGVFTPPPGGCSGRRER